jgi:hypothetical protein
MDERARRLRQKFGPPVPAAGPPSRSGRRWPRVPRRWLAAGTAGLLVVAAAGTFLALTPHDHVAPGCFWWTARQLGDATSGTSGCVRGYVSEGGGLAEGPSPQAFALSYSTVSPDHTTHRNCPYQPGDAVVARYHSVFDDGRTLIVIDACR